MTSSTSFSIFFFFIIVSIVGYSNFTAANDLCGYTIHVQTGSDLGAGTNSRISLTLGDAKGSTVYLPDLAKWGVNGPTYDYFESGSLDTFSGKANCIRVCSIIVTSDNTGYFAAWKLDYVEMVTVGPHMPPTTTSNFQVDRWLALNTPPYSLSASVEQCYGETAEGPASDMAPNSHL